MSAGSNFVSIQCIRKQIIGALGLDHHESISFIHAQSARNG